MGRDGEVCIESHDEQKEEIEMVSHIRTGRRRVSGWLMMMADGKTTNVDGCDANTKDEGISLQSVLGRFFFFMLGTVSSFGSQQFPGVGVMCGTSIDGIASSVRRACPHRRP